tara:strand:- start:2784 stop:3146 length:363 start_codon:yes stop_codon:yes gene_type:complete
MNELIEMALSPASASQRLTPGHRLVEHGAKSNSRKEPEGGQQNHAQPSQKQLEATIDRLAKDVFSGSRLAIEKHQGSNTFVYRLIDTDTGGVVRQWPTESLLHLREYLRTRQAGVLDQQA